jgi:hypothetical protein
MTKGQVHWLNEHAGERLSALVLVWGSAVALYVATIYNAGYFA